MCGEVTDILDSICHLIWTFSVAFYGGAYWTPHSESYGWEEGHMLITSTFLPLVKDLLSQWHLGPHFDAQIIPCQLLWEVSPQHWLQLQSSIQCIAWIWYLDVIPHPPMGPEPCTEFPSSWWWPFWPTLILSGHHGSEKSRLQGHTAKVWRVPPCE